MEAVTRLVVKDGRVVGDWVGKDGAVILKAAGISPPPGTEGAIMVVGFDHPLVKIEQMLPVLPIVIVDNFEEGLQLAVEAEQGFGHTGIIHSGMLSGLPASAGSLLQPSLWPMRHLTLP